MMRVVVGLVVVFIVAALLWLEPWTERHHPLVPHEGAAPRTTPMPPVDDETPAPELAGRQPLEGAPRAALPQDTEPTGGGSLEVLVVDLNGNPIAGLLVEAWQRGTKRRSQAATDSGGVARFEGVSAGPWWTRPAQEGYTRPTEDAVVEPGRVVRARLEVEPQVPVRGRVIWADGGRVAADATVRLERGGVALGRTDVRIGCPPVAELSVDDEGRFSCLVDPGRIYTLCAHAPGSAEARSSIARSESGRELRLPLVPGGTVSGIVHAPDGRPSPHALVFIVPSAQEEMLANPRTLISSSGATSAAGQPPGELGPLMLMSSTEGDVTAPRVETADAEGRFEVAHLPLPGAVRVLAEGRDGARGAGPALELNASNPTSECAIALEARRSVHVRILDPSGDPVEGLRVGLEGTRVGGVATGTPHFLEPRGEETWWGLSGPEGCLFFNLAPGTYTVAVEAPEGVAREEVVVAGTADADIVVHVASGGILEGVVVDGTGEGVAHARLQWNGTLHTADEEGAFRIPEGGPEQRTLRVEGTAHLPRSIEVLPTPQPLRIVLQARPVVTGRIVPSEGGKSPRGKLRFRQLFESGTEHWGRVALDDDGRFVLPLEEAGGTVQLVLLPEDAVALIRGPLSLEAGTTQDLGDLQVDHGRTLSGRVLTEASAAVPGARVRVVRPEVMGVDLISGPEGGAVTGDDGVFVVRDAPSGPVTLRISHEEHAPTQVVASDGVEMLVHLAPGSYLAGRIEGRGGPRLRVRVQALDATLAWIRPQFAKPDAYGRFWFGPLPKGQYRIAWLDDGTWRELGDVQLAAGEKAQRAWRAR